MAWGNIAQKAYLPLYAGTQDEVEWLLMGRNPAHLNPIAAKYHLNPVGRDLNALDAIHLDAVMIHTPTQTHEALVRHFLTRGVNVYVDKPLTEDFAQTQALYQLAAAQGCLLTLGFNRRLAPAIADLVDHRFKNMVSVVKTTGSAAGAPVPLLYDMFIHPLDTMLALTHFQVPQSPHYAMHLNSEGQLKYASICFDTGRLHATATLDLMAGGDYEEANIIATDGIYRVQDLQSSTVTRNGRTQVSQADKWSPMLETRGFAPLVRAFIAAVQGTRGNPVAPASSLLTHRMIADYIAHFELA
ncbi:MAG: Gfo/Idh/MocA family protein [Sporolactobacillus sp.]